MKAFCEFGSKSWSPSQAGKETMNLKKDQWQKLIYNCYCVVIKSWEKERLRKAILQTKRYRRASKEIFSSSPRPDRLWDPTSLLLHVYQGLLSRGVKPTIRLQYCVEVKNVCCYTATPPIPLHGVVLNYAQDASSWRRVSLSTRTTLRYRGLPK
jgi:hypothetical protein